MRAPTGYYRKLLSATHPQVRIAFTHTPIYGCRNIDSSKVEELLSMSSDPYAKYYLNGIKDGSMVTIVEDEHYVKVYKNNGDLFFTY